MSESPGMDEPTGELLAELSRINELRKKLTDAKLESLLIASPSLSGFPSLAYVQ